MTNNLVIDTGAERSVTGHLVSGTVFSAIFAGSINYNKYQKDEISKNELVNDTTRMAIQGGIGTASAVATANYIGRGDWISAMTAVTLGAAGIYGTQKIYEKIQSNSTNLIEVKEEINE
jgi:hypothetical protein